MADIIELDRIRLDGGTQPRSSIDLDLVQAYAIDMAKGDPLPPVALFYDGQDYWLADGFHRYHAAKLNDRTAITSLVRQGTQRDAILYSAGANADHGWRRTKEDKRRAVQRLLDDPEWASWSDREIARHCRVDHKTVAAQRPAAAADTGEIPSMRTFTHPKTGQPATMNTANIGRGSRHGGAPMDLVGGVVSRNGAPGGVPKPGGTLPPLTQPGGYAERERMFAEARADMDLNGPICSAIEHITDALAGLPPPEEAARRYPRGLRHCFTPADGRRIAAWFSAFADAWEIENGGAHVVAAE